MENIFEIVANLSHVSVGQACVIWDTYRHFLLLSWSSHAPLLLIAAQAVSASMISFNARKGKYTYWLHSFLLTLFTGFSGGFIAPLLMGQRSGPLENDFLIPIVALAWYATHYCGAHRLWTSTLGKIGHVALLALFRTHSVINFTLQAGRVFPPNRYPSCAVFGPIFCGTLSGCCGLFFPQRGEGFAAVEKDTPWAVQGAFIAAAVSHLVLGDKTGPMGQGVRAVLGAWDKNAVVVAIGTMQLVTLFLQNFRDADASLFAPVHRLLYSVSGVNGPLVVPSAAAAAPMPIAGRTSDGSSASALAEAEAEKDAEAEILALSQRLTAERWLNRAKIAVCVLGCMYVIAQRVPPTALPPGGYLEPGDRGLAHCVWMQSYRDCVPLRLKLSAGQRQQTEGEGGSGSGSVQTYTLALYGPADSVRWQRTVSVATATHSSQPAANDAFSASGSGSVRAYVDAAGSVLIVRAPPGTDIGEQSQQVLWKSAGTCSSDRRRWPRYHARLAIDAKTGMPVVVCAFGERIALELQGEGQAEGEGQAGRSDLGKGDTPAAGEL